MEAERSTEVAVIGGGCAGLTTAYELSRPEHGGRYRVTVYQQGWRLGGKGASGRGPSGRIEEHGLHLWMGWYENAFRLIRDCYAELGRDPETCPIATWQDAFEPASFLGVMEKTSESEWLHWTAHFPAGSDLPGDPYPEGHRFSMAHYLVRSASLVRSLLGTLSVQRPAASPGKQAAGSPGDGSPEAVAAWIRRLAGYGEVAGISLLGQAAAALEAALRRLTRGSENNVLALLKSISTHARAELEAFAAEDAGARRLWTILDLTLATMRGIISCGLLDEERGFDAIDEYECREWLMAHGASRSSVETGYLRGLYDLGFAYEDADPNRPAIAAGQALRSMIRAFFTYRGAFFWRMQAGMGDVVFAPLYEVLKRRGVRFEFFHRLESVRLCDTSAAAAGDTPHVAALDFDVQAEIHGGGEFQPLVDVKGLPCWPSTPDWSQLEHGQLLRDEGVDFESFWDGRRVGSRTLRVGQDFDIAVLAVGVGAVPHVCREIVERDPRWRMMVQQVKSVATQAFQIWMEPDTRELGWPHGTAAISGFVEPFDTWADMTHLLRREDWSRVPGSLAYFCNVLPDEEGFGDRARVEYPGRMSAIVRRNAISFLNRDVVHLWPLAQRAPGEFRWDALVDHGENAYLAAESGEKRFDTQFHTANVNPSDRYALSLPGSLRYRISPLDDTYDNLTIAGDWTSCGFNAGCVEAAVMSGLLAAHAVSLSPRLEDIIGYDHP
ncbi:MAG: FAD-dependent oxidoreductase [Myxococcota bacterium]|nr:FAD-dependent oxidoreductase [Myxococcota bacterium]